MERKREGRFNRDSYSCARGLQCLSLQIQGHIIIGPFPWEPRQWVWRLPQPANCWMVVKREGEIMKHKDLPFTNLSLLPFRETSLSLAQVHFTLFDKPLYHRRKKLQTNPHCTFGVLINYFLGRGEVEFGNLSSSQTSGLNLTAKVRVNHSGTLGIVAL